MGVRKRKGDPKPKKNEWYFYWSEKMPLPKNFQSNNRDFVEFDWLEKPAMEPHMLMFYTKAIDWRKIVIDYTITPIRGTPRFAQNECFTGNGVGVANCQNEPCNFGFILQRDKDDLTDRRPFYRWWSRKRQPLTANATGQFTIDLVNDAVADWTTYPTPSGWQQSQFPSALNAAISKIAQYGLAFGGGRGYAHGVNIFDGDVRVRLDFTYYKAGGNVITPGQTPAPAPPVKSAKPAKGASSASKAIATGSGR